LYGVAKEIIKAERAEAFALVRCYLPIIILRDLNEEKIQVNEIIKEGCQNKELFALIYEQGKWFKVRVIVVKMSTKETEKRRRRARRTSIRNGRTPSAISMHLCEYMVLLTTIPEDQASAEKCCNMYRLRWQIELFFKRCKSISKLGILKKCKDALAKTIIAMKMLMISIAVLEASRYREGIKKLNIAKEKNK
jgi:hypothetical protein